MIINISNILLTIITIVIYSYITILMTIITIAFENITFSILGLFRWINPSQNWINLLVIGDNLEFL